MFFYGPGNAPTNTTQNNNGNTGGFVPLDNINNNQNQNTNTNNETSSTSIEQSNNSQSTVQTKIPALRLLSKDPVGGYGASTTASTTIIRWVDRGRGNVLEAQSDTENIETISNTVLPRVYESLWASNLGSFIGTIVSANSDIPGTIYAKLNKQSTSTLATTTNITPFALRGKNLPENTIGYASSPKGDKLFILVKENNQSVGYISNFDGSGITKIFTNPLTQLVVEWPETNTIAITTKAGSSVGGYLYFVNPKTGSWKKILGPIKGLATKVSKDAKYILTSETGKDPIPATYVYKVGSSTPIQTTLRTLAEKCTWGKFYKELLYCATPSSPVNGIYPDDWYKGIISTYDKIWQYNTKTADVRLVSNLLGQTNSSIDIFNIQTDQKDDFLIFMNKDYLSLWSLDLIGI
jgi:hypothetical protein